MIFKDSRVLAMIWGLLSSFPKKAMILTRCMWRSILGHAFYQFAILIVFIFFAAGPRPAAGVTLAKGGLLDMYSGWVALDDGVKCGQPVPDVNGTVLARLPAPPP